ncbi:MAG: ABC transporter substrate-binding protein [Bauldia sp.]|nr:ABC transporter substrate-binding protein [Bauldia sp.]
MASATSTRRLGSRLAGSALLFAAVLAASSPAAAQPIVPPQRIVSMDICADQLLLGLADRSQIAALSADAADRSVSFLASAAEAFPHDVYNAEGAISYDPDLVLVGPETSAAAVAALERLGYPIAEIGRVRTIDQAIRQVTEVAALIGREQAGVELVELIVSARVQATRADVGLTALYYTAMGETAGDDTLIADLMRAVGLSNAVTRLVGSDGGHLPLERLVADPPDFLIVARADLTGADRAAGILVHPALDQVLPPTRRLELPERLTVCGGPSLPEAIRVLYNEYRRVTPVLQPR